MVYAGAAVVADIPSCHRDCRTVTGASAQHSSARCADVRTGTYLVTEDHGGEGVSNSYVS